VERRKVRNVQGAEKATATWEGIKPGLAEYNKEDFLPLLLYRITTVDMRQKIPSTAITVSNTQ
jgi:hypothetical protein